MADILWVQKWTLGQRVSDTAHSSRGGSKSSSVRWSLLITLLHSFLDAVLVYLQLLLKEKNQLAKIFGCFFSLTVETLYPYSLFSVSQRNLSQIFFKIKDSRFLINQFLLSSGIWFRPNKNDSRVLRMWKYICILSSFCIWLKLVLFVFP